MNNDYHKQEGKLCPLARRILILTGSKKKIQSTLNVICRWLLSNLPPNHILMTWKRPYRSSGLTSHPLQKTLSQNSWQPVNTDWPELENQREQQTANLVMTVFTPPYETIWNIVFWKIKTTNTYHIVDLHRIPSKPGWIIQMERLSKKVQLREGDILL